MYELIFYKENDITKVKSLKYDYNYNKKYEQKDPIKAIKIFNDIKKSSDLRKLISKVNYSGNSLSFRFDGVKIVLQNYDDFRHDSNFWFIFKYIKDRNYRIKKIKQTLMITSVASLITCAAVTVKMNSNNKIDQIPLESSTSLSKENTTYFEDDVTLTQESMNYDENLFGRALDDETTTKKEKAKLKDETTSTTKQETTITKTTTATTTFPETTQSISMETTTKNSNTTTTKKVEEEITKALINITQKNDEELRETTTKATDDSIIRISGDTPYYGNSSSSKPIYLTGINVKEPSDDEKQIVRDVKANYGSIIQKYCSMYNVDYELMCAVAAQESGGKHSSVLSGSAIGLMQIELGAYDKNEYIKVHNYFNGTEEKLYPKKMNLGNVSENIKFACALMKYHEDKYKNNHLIALQAYNKGSGAMDKYLLNYAEEIYGPFDRENKDTVNYYIDLISSNYSDTGWIDFVTGKSGDNDYIAHVLKFYEGNLYVIEKTKTK